MVNIGNIRLKQDGGQGKESAKSAEQRKISTTDTFDEAWERILSMKNSDKDDERLREVRNAMFTGRIGREPVKEGEKKKKFSKAEALRLYRKLAEEKNDRRLQEMIENVPDNYWLVQDTNTLSRLCDLLEKEDEIVFDVETTGPDVWSDYIVGHVITAIKADVHAYIPTKHKTEMGQLNHAAVMETLRPYYEDESLGKLAHNAGFDIHMFDREGITLRGLTWDTLAGMKLLNENEQSFALKKLATKYLRIQSETYGELFGNVGFDEVSDLRVALAYAAKDGDVTRKLRNFQRHHLGRFPNMLRYFEKVEIPLIPAVVSMEKQGNVIDLDFAEDYGDELRNRAGEVGQKVFVVLGDINLNSVPQLKSAIESHIGKGIENTDAKKTLKPMSKDYEVIRDLLEYREITKLLSTYIDALPNMISEVTGKLHGQFFQNGTVTGRFSSRSPNLQNQPEEARKMFIAPTGYYIVNADFSSQEVRIIASESQEKVLLDAFSHNRDPYATLASEFFDKPYEEVYKKEDGSDTEERKKMKVVLLSSMYGASKYGLAESLGVSVEEAEEFRVNFFDKYRNIKTYMDEAKRFANKYGFVWIGDKYRKRRLPDAKGGRNVEQWQQRKSLRMAANAKIQGLAAIQTKETLIEIDKESEKRGWQLVGTTHDENQLIIPNDNKLVENVRRLNDIMTQTFLIDGVENETDIEIQNRWSESITFEEFLKGEEVPQL